MKLSHIQEASYRDESEWVEWVRAQFDKIGPDPEIDKICLGNERKVSSKELRSVINDLTRAFGKPETEDRYKDQHFQWVWHLGGTGGYRIVAFPWGVGEIYAGICVGKNYKDIQEASYHRHDPILTWLKGAFEHKNASNGIVKILTKEQFKEIRNILFDQLGEPSDVDGENITWYVDNEHGRFYVDLQDMFGVTPQSKYRLTVSRLDQPAAVFNSL